MELWLRLYVYIETHDKSETKLCELKAATRKSMCTEHLIHTGM